MARLTSKHSVNKTKDDSPGGSAGASPYRLRFSRQVMGRASLPASRMASKAHALLIRQHSVISSQHK